MKHSLASFLFALAALRGLLVPAQAQISLSGTVSGDGVLTPISPTLIHQAFTLTGDDTTLGSFTGQSSADRDITDLLHQILSNGMFTETFKSGTLFGTFTGTAALTSRTTGTFKQDYVFTGGTGMFAGATGTAMVTGTATLTSPTTFEANGSYKGTLFLVPEPGTLALLTGMSLSCGGFLRRRARRA